MFISIGTVADRDVFISCDKSSISVIIGLRTLTTSSDLLHWDVVSCRSWSHRLLTLESVSTAETGPLCSNRRSSIRKTEFHQVATSCTSLCLATFCSLCFSASAVVAFALFLKCETRRLAAATV